jgi:hypothetical protein
VTWAAKLRRRACDESGASLILALVFILVTSVTVLSLSTLASNGLINVAQFRTPQLARSALDSAMTTAIDEERYTVTPASITSAALCASNVAIPESNETYTFQIWCSTSEDEGSNTATRSVTFTACPSTSTQTICSSAASLLVASVNFDDYPYHGAPILISPNYCTTYCGIAETITSWVLT